MAIHFVDAEGKQIGSTALGKQVILEALKANPDIQAKVKNLANWREEYLIAFRETAKAELANDQSAFQVASAGLAKFEKSLMTENNSLLIDEVKQAWRLNKDLVSTVVVSGTGVSKFAVPTADNEVQDHLAEPGVIEALKGLSNSKIQDDLLIALAGGAEYSPARVWLDWGGVTAIVARNRKELWLELIQRARSSSGTLYVPVLKSRTNKSIQELSDEELAEVAGLDLVEDYVAIAGWLSSLARSETRRLVLGSFAYAPGTKHIQAQAVQHCLGRVLTENLPKSRVFLTWLATPTDSYAVSLEVLADIKARYFKRKFFTKLRDIFFGLRANNPELFETDNGETLVVIDSTSSLQGPSYALAKRVQRWMAYEQVYAERGVGYLVSPPAKTQSVLSKRILRATYKGAPAFGLKPFETDKAVTLSAALLLSLLNSPQRIKPMGSYLDLAVHGGLWRLIYSPKGVWRAATIKGIFALFSR
jgi:hypothetical protein